MKYQIEASTEGDVTRVILSGELTQSEVDSFRAWVENDLLPGDPGPALELDCSGLSYVDSSGLGAFIYLRKRLIEEGCTLRMTELSGWLKKFLEVTGLVETFCA